MAKVDKIPTILSLLKETLTSELEQEETVDIKYIKDLGAVIASIGGKRIGALRIKPFKEGYQVDTVSVSPDYRKLGIGTEMYRVAFEALNSLYSDKYQTPDAKRIWNSLINSGEAEKIGERYKMTKVNTSLKEDSKDLSKLELPDSHLTSILREVVNSNSINFSQLEKELDVLFDKIDVDVSFTTHFKERVLERGLTEEDIIELANKVIDSYGNTVADLPKDQNVVFSDLSRLVDIAAVSGGFGADYLKDLIFKTAYKRFDKSEPEFRTNSSSPKLTVQEDIHDPVQPGILKDRLGKLSCTKVRTAKAGLKDKGTHYAKALQRYLNYHCK